MYRSVSPIGIIALLITADATLIGTAVALGKGAEPECTPILEEGQTGRDLRAYLLRRTPKFALPASAATWDAEQERLRQRVLKEIVLRGVPRSWWAGKARFEFQPGAIPGNGYVIRKLRYEVVPGLWAGGLLYETVNLQPKVPAVLNPNGHHKEGFTRAYKQTRCINLAKRGMLALSLEWIGMGQLRKHGTMHDDSRFLDLCGRSGVSVFYLAIKRGLDVLLAHPSADPQRVAVTGLSGGGWQTILISALDTRVKLAVPNAGYTGFEDRVHYVQDVGDSEQNPTDLRSIVDYVHFTAMLAPRPALLIFNEKDDCCFVADRARRSVFEPIVPLYELHGHPDRFAFHLNTNPGTHNYERDNREAFYRFLNRHFLPPDERNDREIPVDDEICTPEELAIEYPSDNATFHTLAAELMKSLPKHACPAGDIAVVNRWRERVRPLVEQIVRPEPGLTVDSGPQEVTIPDIVRGASVQAWRVRVGGAWTLPVVVYTPQGVRPTGTALIVSDGERSTNRSRAKDLIEKVIAAQQRAIFADVLFSGECQPTGAKAWHGVNLIESVGQRTLGIQASQLWALMDWVQGAYDDEPVRVVARGRVVGLAALVATALKPEKIKHLELRQMKRSLKDLLEEHIRRSPANLMKDLPFRTWPSMFCFGLLERVDVPDLIQLAAPTTVDMIDEH